MEHLVRVGGLLAAVLVITALAILVPRWVSPPDFLEDYGLYRGTDDSEEWANWPQQYADSSTCKECHEDKYAVWAESQHSPSSVKRAMALPEVIWTREQCRLWIPRGSSADYATMKSLAGPAVFRK